MGRRIYIIPKSMKVEDALQDAELANCPEIVHGIPPRLEGIIDEASLPMVFEEPELPPPPEPRNLEAELDALSIKLDALNVKVFGTETEPPRSTHISTIEAIDTAKARPVRIKWTWEGKDYFYDCFATESVKDQYLGGDIKVGDYVIVFWSDVGEQIVTAKVFKSW